MAGMTMEKQEDIRDHCPKCGSEEILEIIIDGFHTHEEMRLLKNKSHFGAHHKCSQCGYSPTLD